MRIARTRNTNFSRRYNYRISRKRRTPDNFFSGRETSGPSKTFFSGGSHGVHHEDSGIRAKSSPGTKPKCIADPAKFTIPCPDKKAVCQAMKRARAMLNAVLKKMNKGPVAVPEDPGVMNKMQLAYVLFFKVDQGGMSHRQIFGIKENFRLISKALRSLKPLYASADCCDCRSGEMLHNAFHKESSIYFCPAFFTKDVDKQAKSIIHELAHAQLGIGHKGDRFLAFGCSENPLKTYDDAVHNAYSYDHFIYCVYYLP